MAFEEKGTTIVWALLSTTALFIFFNFGKPNDQLRLAPERESRHTKRFTESGNTMPFYRFQPFPKFSHLLETELLCYVVIQAS